MSTTAILVEPKLAGAATSSVEQVVSERFKALVEERVWRQYSGIDLKIDLLGETSAIWVIPDLEELLQQEYSPYRAAEALTRIATSAEYTNTKETAISALLRGLKNQNKRVRSIVIRRLGLIKRDKPNDIAPQRIIEVLLTLLKDDSDSTIRNDAAEALGKINDSRAMDGLIAALEDSDSYVRKNAIRALGNLKSTKPLELIIHKLQDPERSVRLASATTVGQIGNDRAINPLISLLQNADPITRWSCAEALGNIGEEEAIAPLILALQDEYIAVQRNAIIALGKIGSEITIEPLKEFVKHSESSLRKQAIIAINRITRMNGEQPPIQLLLFTLNDNESKIKQLAAQDLLTKTNHLGTFSQSLLNGLQHSSATVRIESIKFLGSMTTDNLKDLGLHLVVDALITRLLEDNSLTVKKFAANSLGQIGNEKAITPLISVLQNQSEHLRVRRSTIYALEKIGTEQTFQPIMVALKDPIDYVRIDAASALSRIAGNWAIKDLVASLSDTKLQVRQNLCRALEKIGGIKVEEELLNALSNFTITAFHRRTIFSLLPKVGDRESFDTLISLLTYPSKSIRSEATTEIGLFARDRKDIDYINKAVEPLITALGDRKSDVRDSVARALGHIAIHSECTETNKAAIISALEVAIKNRDRGACHSAINALAKIPRQNAFDYLIERLAPLDIWTAQQTIEELGRMIHAQTTTKLAKFPLTDAQIDLAMEKIEQASRNSNWLISKPAKEMLAQLKTN